MKNLYTAVGTVLATAMASLTLATPVAACDLCSVYTAVAMEQAKTGPRVGLAEQFSSLKTLQLAGDEVPNEAGEMLRSSVTQLLIGYNFSSTLGVQASVPWIERHFRQATETGTGTIAGREDGLGDVALTGRWVALDRIGENQTMLRATLRGGVKLPTGDSDLLAEELHDDELSVASQGESLGGARQDGSHEGGVHAHDLALGTGSTDYLAGADLFASRGRAFASLAVDYTIRTEGDHDYRYADDLTIAGGPGLFFTRGASEHRLAVQVVGTMQSKGQDTQAGQKVSGSALTALYLGPRVLYSWRTSLVAELALDLPAILNNSGLSVVPDYRLRAGFTWLQ